ncbi:MAG: 50S ribosomal protein L5 [Acidiphilium sp. 37-67-22]|nr:MAG: 50S ribosomal protein L5 [Acidiphilium sp. 37-67-22]
MSEAIAKTRLQLHYESVVRAALQKEFGYTNPMQVPKLEKIVINMGVGEAAADQKKLDAAVADRDFRGISGKGFDGRGNFAMGLKEQIMFPEIEYDKVDEMRGMDIVFVTSAQTDAEAKALLKGFEIPFVN